MKTCCTCKLELPDSSFSWKIKGVKRNSACIECQKVYKKKHYASNRKKYMRKAKVYGLTVVKDKIRKMKESSPCVDCGGMFHYCQMDFDHVRGSKKFNLSQAYRKTGMRKILEEVGKCDLVCANCHRLRTFTRAQGREALGRAAGFQPGSS